MGIKMEFELKKVRLEDLVVFSESELFKSFKTIPISKNRIESYINNPRANKTDYVLYLAFNQNELVGFRTILPDQLFINQNEYKFAWFSGSWASTKYRRKGIATFLMKEVMRDWNGNLMFANYAPNAKSLFDKSQQFKLFTERKGLRLYFKAQFSTLLPPRAKVFEILKPLLKIADSLINLFIFPFNYIKKNTLKRVLINFELSNNITPEITDFISKNNPSVFKRSDSEFNWIFNYPWVKAKNTDTADYPFSNQANTFYYKFILSRNANHQIESLAIVKNKNNELSIPYIFALSKQYSPLSKAVLAYSYLQNAKLLTCYNSNFIECTKKLRATSFMQKKMNQKYFISSAFYNKIENLPNKIELMDGDGDCIFT